MKSAVKCVGCGSRLTSVTPTLLDHTCKKCNFYIDYTNQDFYLVSYRSKDGNFLINIDNNRSKVTLSLTRVINKPFFKMELQTKTTLDYNIKYNHLKIDNINLFFEKYLDNLEFI